MHLDFSLVKVAPGESERASQKVNLNTATEWTHFGLRDGLCNRLQSKGSVSDSSKISFFIWHVSLHWFMQNAAALFSCFSPCVVRRLIGFFEYLQSS